jgi:hypothetical protein
LPGYPQFDNDMIFQGTHRYPDALGRVIRLCLSLEVVPVFVPPRETGFQAMIESYNGWWQAKVWSRFQHAHPEDAQGHSRKYVAALLKQRAARLEAAPDRRAFPANWKLDVKKRPRGRLVFVRRSNGSSAVTLLGRSWPLGQVWPNRLVRCEVDLDKTRSASSPSDGRSRPVSRRSWKWTTGCSTGASRSDGAVRHLLAVVSMRAIYCSGSTGTYPVRA